MGLGAKVYEGAAKNQENTESDSEEEKKDDVIDAEFEE